MITSNMENDSVLVLAVTDARPFKNVIVKALGKINERSGNRYAPELIYDSIAKKIEPNGYFSSLLLMADVKRIANGASKEDSICGLLTLDMFQDEIGKPVCMISRAWSEPGVATQCWKLVKPLVWEWAKERNCVRIQCQSERDSAWARWLKSDGFKIKETLLEVELNGGSI